MLGFSKPFMHPKFSHLKRLIGSLLFPEPWRAARAAYSTEIPRGAGSSAAAPLIQAWARAYHRASGASLAYRAAGSQAAGELIRAGEPDFGVSDVAPAQSDLASDGLVMFPVAVTGIAPVVNLLKVADGQLRLTGDVLARIFMGEITQWHAPEIAGLNPGIALPALPIHVVVRADGSGTTCNFADYLSKVSLTWNKRFGAESSFEWPGAFEAVAGSDAMVKAVRETEGAIGYVAWGHARAGRLACARLENAEGEFTVPSSHAFRSALVYSEWATTRSFATTLTHRPGKASWPIPMGTFAIVPRVMGRQAPTAALRFLAWSFLNCEAIVAQHGFVCLPHRVQAAASETIKSIKDTAGNPIGLAFMSSFQR
jgi:phosphate transport system substrate-binding protein